MKRLIVVYVLCLFCFIGLPAQDRLHTCGARRQLPRVNEILELIDKHSPSIENVYISPGTCEYFYIDVCDTIHYFNFQPHSTVYDIKVAVNEKASRILNDLIHVVVSTSSPQDDYDGFDASMYYFVHKHDIAEGWSDTWSITRNQLLTLFINICSEIKTFPHRIPDGLLCEASSLIRKYQEYINYEVKSDAQYIQVGSYGGIINVQAYTKCPDIISFDKDDCQDVILKLSKHLAYVIGGKVECNIEIVCDPKQLSGNTDIRDLCILPEDFNSIVLIDLCDRLLCH